MRFGYQLLLWVLWFGGEFGGGFVAGMASVASGEYHPNMIAVYLFALIGAVVGAVIAFAVVNGVPSLKTGDDFYFGPDRFDRRFNRVLPDRVPDPFGDDSPEPAHAERDDRVRR